MNKLISIFLFTIISLQETKYPSVSQVEKDLNRNNKLLIDKFPIDKIIKYYPTDTAAKHDFYFDKYCLIHVSIPDEYYGCSLDESPVLLYAKNGSNWGLKSVLAGLYDFEQINKTDMFLSQVSCTQMNSEQNFLTKLYKLQNEKFITIEEINGYDRSMYLLQLLNGGLAFDQGEEGYERYRDYKKTLKQSLGDTIADYSILKTSVLDQTSITSYTIQRKIKILNSISATKDNGLDIFEKIIEKKVELKK
jgi:hypothetical protein